MVGSEVLTALGDGCSLVGPWVRRDRVLRARRTRYTRFLLLRRGVAEVGFGFVGGSLYSWEERQFGMREAS